MQHKIEIDLRTGIEIPLQAFSHVILKNLLTLQNPEGYRISGELKQMPILYPVRKPRCLQRG
jgi:hypothetical protein